MGHLCSKSVCIVVKEGTRVIWLVLIKFSVLSKSMMLVLYLELKLKQLKQYTLYIYCTYNVDKTACPLMNLVIID